MALSNSHGIGRRTVLAAGTAAVAASALPLNATPTAAKPAEAAEKTAADTGNSRAKPTVVLVHGAFADASGWHGVIGHLNRAGYPVIAPANPLRDLTGDAAYIASVAAAVSGPVVLVGHSYGGAVITNAARSVPRTKALVYVAAFAPDTGESLAKLSARFPATPLADAIRPQPFPLPDGEKGVDIYLDRAKFGSIFAQDIPASTATLLAATQRPMTEAAFTAASGAPAWKKIPSWYQVSRHDRALHPAAQRFFAQRMRATTVELPSSHASMISQPAAVAALIRAAANHSAK